MKFKLPDAVSSPQDLDSLIMDIQEYARWFMHESIKKKASAKRTSEPPAISAAALDVIHDWEKEHARSRATLDALIRALTDYKMKAPSITLTLAAPPTRPVKTDLVVWCRENIAHDILINFQFNSTLLGGMVVRSGSHVFDWSFRRQILENRHKIPEVLRSV